MRKFIFLSALFPINVLCQTLECQLLRDEILSEAKQMREINSESTAWSQGFAAGNNLLGGILANQAIANQRMAQGLSSAFGQNISSFEQKVELYKSKCEK